MRSRFRRTRRDRSRPSLYVRLVRVITFDPYNPVTRLLLSVLISISLSTLYTKTLSFCHSTNENYIAKMHTSTTLVWIFLGSFFANPHWWISLLLSFIDLQLSRTSWIHVWSEWRRGFGRNGPEVRDREKWNDKRRWNANSLHSRVSCYLSPPASGSLNFTSRYTSLTRMVYCSFSDNAVLLSAVPFIFFSSDNEHDAIQLVHCSRHLRTKLLLDACIRYTGSWRKVQCIAFIPFGKMVLLIIFYCRKDGN